MTDKQQGWNDALNIVIEKAFDDVARLDGRSQERQEHQKAVEDMEKRVEHKIREQSQDYRQAMRDVVEPFCKTLKGENRPNPPFKIALPEAEKQGRNDALEIVLDTFRVFARREDLQMEWTCSEIAEDMEKLVDYEDREKSQDYMQAMADVVKPFYKELKNEPQREC